jgi:hypothetical protein
MAKPHAQMKKEDKPEVRLGMKKADMVAGLKKIGHWDYTKDKNRPKLPARDVKKKAVAKPPASQAAKKVAPKKAPAKKVASPPKIPGRVWKKSTAPFSFYAEMEIDGETYSWDGKDVIDDSGDEVSVTKLRNIAEKASVKKVAPKKEPAKKAQSKWDDIPITYKRHPLHKIFKKLRKAPDSVLDTALHFGPEGDKYVAKEILKSREQMGMKVDLSGRQTFK